MAYFGRSLKKPQQRGRTDGGRTRSGFERATPKVSGAHVTKLIRRALADPRPERQNRNVRAERSAR